MTSPHSSGRFLYDEENPNKMLHEFVAVFKNQERCFCCHLVFPDNNGNSRQVIGVWTNVRFPETRDTGWTHGTMKSFFPSALVGLLTDDRMGQDHKSSTPSQKSEFFFWDQVSSIG